ncbi:unnamed protein product [Soboliphyme baturini]|uniref:Peptidase S1 domain-containing protein n=1 Tax=Soboliphyme baturini TaxID=241478 RepID=A0A183IEI3_9BILA|nr:unnamed protein product [Soboliphyme baturini]
MPWSRSTANHSKLWPQRPEQTTRVLEPDSLVHRGRTIRLYRLIQTYARKSVNACDSYEILWKKESGIHGVLSTGIQCSSQGGGYNFALYQVLPVVIHSSQQKISRGPPKKY